MDLNDKILAFILGLLLIDNYFVKAVILIPLIYYILHIKKENYLLVISSFTIASLIAITNIFINIDMKVINNIFLLCFTISNLCNYNNKKLYVQYLNLYCTTIVLKGMIHICLNA